MTGRWQKIPITPGTLADERLPRALARSDRWVRPGTLAQSFYAAGQRLGAVTNVLARKEAVASPWSRLFQAEPAFLFAEILSYDADDAAFVFDETLETDPPAACQLVAELAGRMAGWARRMRLDAPDLFARQLSQLDQDVGLSDHVAALADVPAPDVMSYIRGTPRVRAQKTTALREANASYDGLRNTHAVLRNAVASLQPQAQAAFDARIVSGEMDPTLGLLLAEIRAAAKVEDEFNQLPRRHLNFYYKDIIGQMPAEAGPEQVLLDIGPAPAARILSRGSALEARLPDGEVQRFVTEADVPVSPARVKDLTVLRYDTNRDVSYNKALAGITGMRAARLVTGPQAQPRGIFSSGTEVPLSIGLDIASPMFAMAEGTRWIEVSLHMQRKSNLPSASRRLTGPERAAMLVDRRNPPLPENLRRRPETSPGTTDPEVALALEADPALVETFAPAFGVKETPRLIETIAHAVTDLAKTRRVTTSLSLIYEYLAGRVQDLDMLRLLLGRIVRLSLIEHVPFPRGRYDQMLSKMIDDNHFALTGRHKDDPTRDPSDPDTMILAAFSRATADGLNYPPEDIFQSLLGDALALTVTTAAGPRQPDVMQVMPIVDKRSAGGITLRLRFDDSAPALGGATPETPPTLQIRYARDARLCPISFFEPYTIETIAMTVKAAGLKRLAAFSDDGPVGTDQTFQPFGVRPNEGATFQVGCAEMAQKPVTQVGIALEWAEMPHPTGGFETHYADYGPKTQIPQPTLSVDYLSGDGWKPVSTGPEPLFQTEELTGTLLRHWRFDGAVAGHTEAASGPVSTSEFGSRQTVRAGMVRITLEGTADGFHAEQYPLVLVGAMRPRFLPLKERRIPPPPFVPTIGRFTLDYTAETTMELNAPDAAKTGEKVMQIDAFGVTEVFPQRDLRDIRLFPARLGFGALFIQLEGEGATGALTLTFDMTQAGHLRLVPDPNPIAWRYLSRSGWQTLPETAVSADTTYGLMRSGLVQIDLPDDAIAHSTEMPAGGVWIAAVAQQAHLDIFPALCRVKVNGVWARRSDTSYRADHSSRVWTFDPPQPGLTEVAEIASPADIRPPEDDKSFYARVGERLRHRKRAVTPWDVERLVIDRFPEVWMAKCLPHTQGGELTPRPGHMTIVVVRKPPDAGRDAAPQPALFEVGMLNGIKSFVSEFASDLATIEVVNPAFERLQVRAKVAFDAQREGGAMAQTLKRELNRYLSVWTAGVAMRRFGWSLNVQMLQAHLKGLSYLRDLTDFSVLHLVSDDNARYRLLDTAQAPTDWRGTYGPIIKPHFPWSLPLAATDHVLAVLPELQDEAPTASGIGSLAVGDMLIVGQRVGS